LVADCCGVNPLSDGAIGKQNGGTDVSSVPPFRIERVPCWDDFTPLGSATISQLDDFNYELQENSPTQNPEQWRVGEFVLQLLVQVFELCAGRSLLWRKPPL